MVPAMRIAVVFAHLLELGMNYICEAGFKSNEDMIGYLCNFYNIIGINAYIFPGQLLF
jgi:hypothetical protein